MTSLPDYVEFKKFPGIPLKDIFSAAGDDLLDMLDRLLDCNPSGRVNATQVQCNSLIDDQSFFTRIPELVLNKVC